MGLLDKLLNGGSTYTPYNGTTPGINPLATKQSQLHADGAGTPGYSVNGGFFGSVNSAYQTYLDGTNNILPQPSQLDLNGVAPTQYIQNLPE
jgi:hypothetical protein